ncbi:MAG: hypothetical protein WAJ99_13025 [Candidatus Sulfotelmatobacter sp.]
MSSRRREPGAQQSAPLTCAAVSPDIFGIAEKQLHSTPTCTPGRTACTGSTAYAGSTARAGSTVEERRFSAA